MTLTDEQLASIERAARIATDGIELYLKWDGSIVECGVGGKYAPTEHDVELFMHAKHYIAELLAEIGVLRSPLAERQNFLAGANEALQAQLDDVGEALGPQLLSASDGYHGTAVRRLAADIERQTAEQIAQWLDDQRDPSGSPSIRDLVPAIRAGAWRGGAK